jgi:outer membrane receptor for ferrienterochelin and colicins
LKKTFIIISIHFLSSNVIAQLKPFKDTLFSKELNEVIITATRNERKIGNVAVPVTIISQKNIQQAGSLRLKDILQEQPGLFLTSGFGVGVQMQGLNPDYTLILIDGEPLTGRTSGVLDLNRVTTGNIKKIEIVKGPSSSLYGSEALAGVINIITDKSYDKKLNISARYGTYNSLDANINAAGRIGKAGINVFFNQYNTDGYSIRPYSVERSKLPVSRSTPQLQFNYPFSNKTSFNLSLRYNYEHIKNELAVSNNGQITLSNGREINKDLNITPTVTHIFSDKLKTSIRLYANRFEGSQKLETSVGQNYDDYFLQRFYRAENQTDYTMSKNLSFVGGIGYIKEFVNSSRYDDKNSRKENEVKYGFLQAEWQALKKLTLIGGFRYDNNKLYASAFSPKIAGKLTVNNRLSFQASYGKGFKAPDFRQLYLNFTNTSAGSYSVFGALEAQRIIRLMDNAGLIKQYEEDFYRLQELRPEYSNGFNAGFTVFPVRNIQWQVNFFRNDIKDLIESRLVATRQDNTQIFSYVNIQRAFTQGIETNIKYIITPSFILNAGYQYLQTADKDELKKIKAGNFYYTRDQNNFSVLLKKSDYLGLPNRSPHMATLKLSYEPATQSWFANIRATYRSKWVVFDKDGNGIYNKQDEFAKGFVQLSSSIGTNLKYGFRIQAGADNILDHVDINNLPNAPGRTFFTTLAYTYKKIKQPTKNLN